MSNNINSKLKINANNKAKNIIKIREIILIAKLKISENNKAKIKIERKIREIILIAN